MSEKGRTTISPKKEEGLRGDGTPKWYVVHTYSGHENKVKVNIEKLVESRGMQDLILKVVVPTEDKAEPKDGRMVIKTRKIRLRHRQDGGHQRIRYLFEHSGGHRLCRTRFQPQFTLDKSENGH